MFKTKTKTLHLKTKTFLWCILEANQKAFLIFDHKRKCRRKWNSTYSRKRNENGFHFRPKNENESHVIILVFFFLFIHSVTKSAVQCGSPSPHCYSLTFCCLSMPFYGCPCKTLVCDLGRSSHSEKYFFLVPVQLATHVVAFWTVFVIRPVEKLSTTFWTSTVRNQKKYFWECEAPKFVGTLFCRAVWMLRNLALRKSIL